MSLDTPLTEKAWLLSIDGTVIGVHKHPNPKHEFQEIIELINEYGSDKAKGYVKEYLESSSAEAKKEIIDYYFTNWCKVRAWGTFNEEVTFRLSAEDQRGWYLSIVGFLKTHPQFKNSLITAEGDRCYLRGLPKVYTYWNKLSYSFVVNEAHAFFLTVSLS